MIHRFIVEFESGEFLNWENLRDITSRVPYLYEEENIDKVSVFYQDEVCINYERKQLLKGISKQPIYGRDEQDYIVCPSCGYPLGSVDSLDYFNKPKYCSECGQSLSWK